MVGSKAAAPNARRYGRVSIRWASPRNAPKSDMVVFNSTIQGAIPEAMRGRVSTLLDVDWSTSQVRGSPCGKASGIPASS